MQQSQFVHLLLQYGSIKLSFHLSTLFSSLWTCHISIATIALNLSTTSIFAAFLIKFYNTFNLTKLRGINQSSNVCQFFSLYNTLQQSVSICISPLQHVLKGCIFLVVGQETLDIYGLIFFSSLIFQRMILIALYPLSSFEDPHNPHKQDLSPIRIPCYLQMLFECGFFK